jgi:signal transduction histidine kinase
MSKEKERTVLTEERLPGNDLTSAPIRSQLLWASAFPLIIFGLLTILVTASELNRLTLEFAMQRNTAQVQSIGLSLADGLETGILPTPEELLSSANSAGVSGDFGLVLIDGHMHLIASAGAAQYIPISDEVMQIQINPSASSNLMSLDSSSDEVMVSSSTVLNGKYTIILVEPWRSIMAAELSYQVLLVVLSILGIGFSLVTLSLVIGRVIQPIQVLSQRASDAIPGSVFHPLRESGPQEIRALINAFNKMVIRLARQQSTLRQYAHKALLSQEEERLRLSHELHDGTLQDLVALNQRVELCRHELKSDPATADDRLNEIHELLETTIHDVRRMSMALRPPVLEDFGLVAATKALCEQTSQTNPQVNCDLTVSGNPRRLNADMELAVYRVIQEALTNIRKHVPGPGNCW